MNEASDFSGQRYYYTRYILVDNLSSHLSCISFFPLSRILSIFFLFTIFYVVSCVYLFFFSCSHFLCISALSHHHLSIMSFFLIYFSACTFLFLQSLSPSFSFLNIFLLFYLLVLPFFNTCLSFILLYNFSIQSIFPLFFSHFNFLKQREINEQQKHEEPLYRERTSPNHHVDRETT